MQSWEKDLLNSMMRSNNQGVLEPSREIANPVYDKHTYDDEQSDREEDSEFRSRPISAEMALLRNSDFSNSFMFTTRQQIEHYSIKYAGKLQFQQ